MDKEREFYRIDHYQKQDEWLCDYAAEQACIDFIISRMDPVYLKPLRTSKREGFKGKSLEDFIKHLKDTYEATPEERDAIQKELNKPWDTSQHIEYIFERTLEGLETIANMDNKKYTAAQ